MTHPLVFAAAQIDFDVLDPRELPDLAVELLIAGVDCPSLIHLAGENPVADAYVLREYLAAALEELGLERLDRVEAARALCDEVARRVVAGSLTPEAGAVEVLGLQRELESELNDWRQAGELLGTAEIVAAWYNLDDLASWPTDMDVVAERAKLVRGLFDAFASLAERSGSQRHAKT